MAPCSRLQGQKWTPTGVAEVHDHEHDTNRCTFGEFMQNHAAHGHEYMLAGARERANMHWRLAVACKGKNGPLRGSLAEMNDNEQGANGCTLK